LGALSGGTKQNFELAVKKFARVLAGKIHDGLLDEQQAVEALADALLRAARRGAANPQWFEDEAQSDMTGRGAVRSGGAG
jgi:hypothetical protein